MKFGRYLEETLIPEWRRAYIDYRGLKEQISAIEEDLATQNSAHDSKDGRIDSGKPPLETTPPFSSDMNDLGGTRRRTQRSTREQIPDVTLSGPHRAVVAGVRIATATARGPLETGGRMLEEGYWNVKSTPPPNSKVTTAPWLPPTLAYERRGHTGNVSPGTFPPPIRHISDRQVSNQSGRGDSGLSTTAVGMLSSRHQSQSSPSPRNPGSPSRGDSGATAIGPHTRPPSKARKRVSLVAEPAYIPTAMSKALEIMTPLETRFFETLDKELVKVQVFYRLKVKDALARSALIKEQLNELEDHRQIYNAHEDQHVTTLASRIAITNLNMRLDSHGAASKDPRVAHSTPSTSRSPVGAGKVSSPQARLGPEDYKNAKKKLKKAMLEFYRGVECLHNYRILNLMGFRKALKKFERVTQIRVSQLYYDEKIEPSILSDPKTVDDMLRGIEKLYAARFEGGDPNKAKTRLRAPYKRRGNNYSMFRTGLFLGLSLPPFIAGIYESSQPDTRTYIPEWPALIQIYLAFLIPVMFALLFTLNAIVWENVRINYVFIFEWDVRTVLNSRKYAELPAFLLMTLAFAFWFSFSGLDLQTDLQTGLKFVPKWWPIGWPIGWLVFAVLILINPLPVLHPSSRRWILRKTAGLLRSGTRPVSFQDFFLGDQYCSMVYSLTSLYYVGCFYRSEFTLTWDQCGRLSWVGPWLLAALPSSLRLIQCIRRYRDSGQKLHLINAGKYGSSIIQNALYFHWRYLSSPRDTTFAVWALFACIASCYTSSWDILVDWSLFQRGSKYRFLRKELMYSDRIWVYYFAILTNVVVRFGWLLYIPYGGPSAEARIGIIGVAEALRRFQWNFFRLESEHLGNVDQVRAIREVPLPYPMDASEDGEGLRSRWFD